jgi:phosphoglycerate kinase
MKKLSIKDIPLHNKKILMRVDFNVPLNEDGSIADDTRIKAALDSINYILKQNASLILMSHLGRPKGKKDPKLSLKPCAERLSKLLNQKVYIAPDCIGEEVNKLAKNLKEKEILLLENLRFHEAEENPEKDPSFAKQLSLLADIYVDDAFGTAHRKHSSTYTITKYFPNKSLAGLLLEKEITYLGTYLKNPKRPFYAILGGKKISTKIGVIINLIDKVDELFIGGGMAYTFFKYQGKDIGKSIFEEDQTKNVQKIIEKCLEKNISLNLPLDIKIADSLSNEANTKIISTEENTPPTWEGVDIGPKTINIWIKKLTQAKTIFLNGPLGVFEIPSFSSGTTKILENIASLPAITIAGGGDSVFAINSLNLMNQFTHVSTGGGASLEYIEKETLPGVEALTPK